MADATTADPKLAAAAKLLGRIATRLAGARRLLDADDEGSNVDGALALVEIAGALADDGAAALGEIRYYDAEGWHRSGVEIGALGSLKGDPS
jgi:hypothetical protein